MDITGQLIFRDAGKESPNKDGKVLMMVVGILAMEDNSLAEQQVTVNGKYIDHGSTIIKLNLYNHMIDRTEDLKGQVLGKALVLPIWQF